MFHLLWSNVFCFPGIDCCDGTDEYDGKVKCPNTCWEAGKVARDKLKKKIETYQEGVKVRQQEIEQAKLGLAKDEAELSKLKKEESILRGIVQQLKGITFCSTLFLWMFYLSYMSCIHFLLKDFDHKKNDHPYKDKIGRQCVKCTCE